MGGVRQVSDRPQAKRSHASVLAAAVQLLRTVGFAETTIDAIATTSGVSTATIYKHWPTKNAIVAEAFGHYMSQALPVVMSDDPVADLRGFARQAVTFHGQDGDRTFVQLLSACALEPSGQAYLHEYYLGPRRERIAALWERAREQGLVNVQVDADTAMDLIFGPAVFRMLRSADAPQQLSHMVDQVLDHLVSVPEKREQS